MEKARLFPQFCGIIVCVRGFTGKDSTHGFFFFFPKSEWTWNL